MSTAAALLLRLTLPQAGAPDFPVHPLSAPCSDPHFPSLAGEWLVGCGRDGQVDRALDLQTGQLWQLPTALDNPARGEGLLWQPDRRSSAIRLDATGPVLVALVSPAVQASTTAGSLDASGGAATTPSSLLLVNANNVTWTPLKARPASWYPPALNENLVVWVERVAGGTEIRLRRRDQGPIIRLTNLPASNPRHPIAHGPGFLWVEDGRIVLYDPTHASTSTLEVETGFSGPPTSDGSAYCWETRHPTDGIDIHCSDGVTVAGPGHQRWPDRKGRWLVYREGDLPKIRHLYGPP